MLFRIRPSVLRAQWGTTVNRQCVRSAASRTKKEKQRHWTPEKLEAHSEYPLSSQVREKLHPAADNAYGYQNVQKGARAGLKRDITYVRTQIVSPDLCDDVIKYLSPSLEQYKGCDILDINPGAGLWTRKLHEFLKPRSHVLLEPQLVKFDEFLRPLLNDTRSTYKLLENDPTMFETYDRLVKDGTFPHQERVVPRNLAAQELNKSLLVTGSLMWDPQLPGHGFDSMAKQLLIQFSMMAWQRAIFHAFGPVRMLLWIQNDELKSLLPRSALHVGKSSLLLEKLTTMNEVVTAGHKERSAGRSTVGREPRYELQSLVKALKRGKESGKELPVHRRENVHDFAEHVNQVSNGTGIITTPDLMRYLKEQEWSGKSTLGLTSDGSIKSMQIDQSLQRDSEVSAEERRKAARMRATAGQQERLKLKKEETVDLGEKIYDLECKVLGLPDGEGKDSALNELERLDDEFKSACALVNHNIRPQVYSDLDDRLQLRTPVARLQWDSRPYEPLVMSPNEVWPVNRVSLVDITPRPIPERQDHDFYEYVQDFIFGLFQIPAASVDAALENMDHGMSSLVDQAPSLRNPAKGGRLNMKNLRVRMLTVEMVDELVRAYMDWPFRAPDYHNKYFRFKLGAYHQRDV